MQHDIVIKNATIATFTNSLGVLKNASLAIHQGIISEINAANKVFNAKTIIDAEGRLITPGLIDCHTHIAYAGSSTDEFAMRLKDAYIDYIVTKILPIIAAQQLAKFVDGFCEKIAFNPQQIEKLFLKAKELGFSIKLHAEQLSNQKGAVLAAKFNATSVDHLEYLNPDDILALKQSNTVAVLLPSAYYFLKEKQLPPIKELRAAKVPIAIATDANPGSSPFFPLPLIMNMACVLFGFSLEDAWRGVTINAAKALRLDNEIGSIAPYKTADLVIWDTDNLNDIVYNPTINFCRNIILENAVAIYCAANLH